MTRAQISIAAIAAADRASLPARFASDHGAHAHDGADPRPVRHDPDTLHLQPGGAIAVVLVEQVTRVVRHGDEQIERSIVVVIPPGATAAAARIAPSWDWR